MLESAIKKLEMMEPLVSMTGKAEIDAMSKFLYERIIHPDSYVVFLGETSSGKSSIINGLLGNPVLPMKANPTTATITEIELSNAVQCDEYYAINKNATIEKINYDLEYVKTCSVKTDIKIVFMTIKAVFGQKGVDAGKSTIHDEIEALRKQNKNF